MTNIQYSIRKDNCNVSNFGFTLIELLVVVAIVGLMSAISLRGFIGSKNSGQLAMEAQKVMTDVHRAQGYALALKSYNGDYSSSTWGIHFTVGSGVYQIFADGNENGMYSADEKYQDVQMSGGAVVSAISSESTGADLSVTFRPPDPKTYIVRGTESIATATLVLNNASGSSKNLYFSKSGLSDVVEGVVSGDIATNTVAVLNSATGKDCQDLCNDFPRNSQWSCANPSKCVGSSPIYTDDGNRNYWRNDGSDSCLLGTNATRNTVMTADSNGLNCNNHAAMWIYCYCSRN